jgi:hypothetical protein
MADLQPTTDQTSEEVFDVISKATYFVVFTIPDPQSLSTPTALIPAAAALTTYEISIVEAPRRFKLDIVPPTPECGFRSSKVISTRQVANQELQLQVTPNNYESGPGRTPPPTLLFPFVSQRFWMFNGHFDFLDGLGTGFRAIAGGRFFPITPIQALPTGSVYVSGVANILEGLGQLTGFTGNLAIGGITVPPAEFSNHFIFRFVDPEGKLKAESLPPIENPEPESVDFTDSAFIPVIADLHPEHKMTVTPITNSSKKQIDFVERLRLVDTNFDVGPGLLKSHNVIGPEVGIRRTTLVFDPDDPNDTIPVYSVNSEFTFFAEGKTIGTLKADLFEARAFRTTSPELKQPYFRLVGFGPFIEGTGQFKDTEGLLTTNGAISVTPSAISSMYVLRILDPEHRFQAQAIDNS